jgi:hypothetical protein
MRRPDPASAAARTASTSPGRDDSAPVQLVCLALVLAVLLLGCRIASIW